MQTLENNNQNSVNEYVTNLFCEHTGIRWEEKSSIRKIMEYMDELDYLEIVMFIEFHFDIEIEDEEWEQAMNVSNSLSDVIIFVENKLRNKNEN